MRKQRTSGAGVLAATLLLLGAVTWALAASPPATAPAPATGPGGKTPVRRIIVGGDHDFAPFEWINARGEPEGYQVDLFRALGQVMGVEVEFRLGPWAEQISALREGRIDVLMMFNTEERNREFAFTEPDTIMHHVILCRRGGPAASRLSDLSGMKVAVQAGAYAGEHLRQVNPAAVIVEVDSDTQALRELAAGRCDAAFVTETGAMAVAKRLGLANVVLAGPPIAPRRYGMAVLKDQRELLAVLDEGLSLLYETGQYDAIHSRWFAGDHAWLERRLRQGAWGLGLAALVAMGALAWSWSLKRQVAQRTAALLEELAHRRSVEEALRHSEQRLAAMLDNASTVVFVKDMEGRLTFTNQQYLRATGLEHPPLGRTDHELFPRDIADAMRANDDLAMQRTSPVEFEEVVPLADGPHTYLSMKVALRDAAGRPYALCCVATDITQRKLADVALRKAEAAEREARRALLTLMGNLPGMVYRCDIDAKWTMRLVSEGGLALTGYAPEALVGNRDVAFDDLIHPDDRGMVSQQVNAAVRQGERFQITYRLRALDGTEKWVWEVGAPVFDAEGKPEALEGFIIDITDRKLAEKRQKLLVMELDHRVKNNLASVLAMAERMLAHGPSPADFAQTFTGRIRAMARAHEALARGRWQGVSMRDAVAMALQPYEHEAKDRIDVDGPAVALPARVAMPLGLSLHELATNAAKYGALRQSAGRLEVRWRWLDDRHVELQWNESGVGDVPANPGSGMGSQLIRGLIGYELGGEVTMDFAVDGLRSRWVIPVSPVSESTAAITRMN